MSRVSEGVGHGMAYRDADDAGHAMSQEDDLSSATCKVSLHINTRQATDILLKRDDDDIAGGQHHQARRGVLSCDARGGTNQGQASSARRLGGVLSFWGSLANVRGAVP